MNKAIRLVWLTGGNFVLLALVTYVVFRLIGIEHLPNCFVFIPSFFILMVFFLGLIVRKYVKQEKELSIGGIIGIRTLFVVVIVLALLVHMVLDREHVLPLAIVYVVYTIVFSVLETKILLILNEKSY